MDEKKPLVLIGTPYYQGFTDKYVLSSFASIYDLYPKYHIALSVSEGGQVHINRNVIIKSAYENKADYLMFIDTDMMWLPEYIEKLVRSNKDVIGGLCTTRRRPQKVCVYENDGNGRCRPMQDVPNVPFRCWAIGTGFLLLSSAVVRRVWNEKARIGYPFDPIPHNLPYAKANIDSAYLGEDISFCQRLRRLEIDIWCDPSVKPGHVGELVYGKEEVPSQT